MQIILTNGAILSPYMVTGGATHVQGASRDTLNFIFPATENMIALDKAFTEANCESITIIGDNGNQSIHKAYTIRAKLEKATVEVKAATAEASAVTEERITVSMAQRTYTETQLAALTALLDGEV